MLTYTFSHQKKTKKEQTEAETPRGRPLFQQVYVKCFWGSEHPTEKLHHVLTITSKQEKKNSPAHQMNFVGSNYKYMYRGCRNVWTYCVSKLRNDCAMKNFRNFHHPNLRSPPLAIFMNSTADKMPSCGTQPGLFLCFVSYFFALEKQETFWGICSFWTVGERCSWKNN